jgi:hypothetical protein
MKYTTYLQNTLYFFIITQSCFAMEEEITPFKPDSYILPYGSIYFSKKCIYSNNNTPCITNRVTGQVTTINNLQCNSAPSMYDNNTKMIFNCNNATKIYDIKKNEIIRSINTSNGDQLLSVIHSSFDNSTLLIFKTAHQEHCAKVYHGDSKINLCTLYQKKKNSIYISSKKINLI